MRDYGQRGHTTVSQRNQGLGSLRIFNGHEIFICYTADMFMYFSYFLAPAAKNNHLHHIVDTFYAINIIFIY